MKWLACFWVTAAIAFAQTGGALLSRPDALKLDERAVQLVESTGLAVPGLARAGAPALEDARQTLANLKSSPYNEGATFAFLANLKAYLAIADTVPRPYPFPEEGDRQFHELRDAANRLDAHFRALLEMTEAQLHNPDRDDLKRYADANAKSGAPAQGGRAVFLGDSITDGWRLKEYYGGDRDFVNRGISGQITGEMLGRMQADVINLRPQLVLVLAGINDIGRGVSISTIENNLSMIADLSEAHHIQPMFASLLPVSDYHKDINPQYARTDHLPPAKILELNTWLKSFCEQRHLSYVDYYSAMVDKAGFMPADMADDGLHPNARGYRVMAPIALTAIDAVTKPAPNNAKKAPKPAKQQKKGGLKEWLQKEHT